MICVTTAKILIRAKAPKKGREVLGDEGVKLCVLRVVGEVCRLKFRQLQTAQGRVPNVPVSMTMALCEM